MNGAHFIVNTERATVDFNNVFQLHGNLSTFRSVRERRDGQAVRQTNSIQKHFLIMLESVKNEKNRSYNDFIL